MGRFSLTCLKNYHTNLLLRSKPFDSKFKDTLKALGDFENKQKSVWNVFWYVKACTFWKFI